MTPHQSSAQPVLVEEIGGGMQEDQGVAASPPLMQGFAPEPVPVSASGAIANAGVVILDRHPSWVDRWFRNRGLDTVITGEHAAAMYEAQGYVRRPPQIVETAREVADRLRRFQRTLTGWRVTNSDDTDVPGAISDAIRVIDALTAASVDGRRMAETGNTGSGRSPTSAVRSEAEETPSPHALEGTPNG